MFDITGPAEAKWSTSIDVTCQTGPYAAVFLFQSTVGPGAGPCGPASFDLVDESAHDQLAVGT
jgi:hypothetical protein